MSTLKVDGIRSNSASSDAITLASDGTCTANITNRSNRNLIINGSCIVAQRGTSSTSAGYQTVDRWAVYNNGVDEAPTQEQVNVSAPSSPYHLPTSGAHPYKEGFRKAIGITNGNQTSGAQAAGYVWLQTSLEAQDIANSGWDYTNTSSYITLSFWVKSSVAQTFRCYLRSRDGTEQQYPFETGSLSAFTWTKVTKTIPGNANLTFDDNNAQGLQLVLLPFMGTDNTNNSATENAWATYTSAARVKDSASTWYTTNDASFQITGVQLEVSSVATDFEHRSYAQELALCQRYYQVGHAKFYMNNSDDHASCVTFATPMRAAPTMSYTASGGASGSHAPSSTEQIRKENFQYFKNSNETDFDYSASSEL